MTNHDKKYIVGIGEILWDLLPTGKQLGGAPANFAYHVSQFGLPGCVASAIGYDVAGAEITKLLSTKGVTQCIAEVPYPTGSVKVELDANGVPQYEITPDVAWDHVPLTETLYQLAKHTRAVCFGTLAQRSPVSHRTIMDFIDAVPKEADTLIAFDINLRQQFYTKEIVEESMRRCNILKINDEELVIVSNMYGCGDKASEAQCCYLMERYGFNILILTCGVDGSYVFTPEAQYFRPTPLVEVADTVGAGDSFTAAFVASLLRGRSVDEAHATAVATSAFVCSQHGAMPTLPDYITQ